MYWRTLNKRKKEKRKILISIFKDFTSVEDLARYMGISRQGVYDQFKRYDALQSWKEHVLRIKSRKAVVYSLFFVQDPKKRYIGSTKNLEIRLKCHYNELKNNKHYCKELQKDYNIYGKDSLKYEIIKQYDYPVTRIELVYDEKVEFDNTANKYNTDIPV